MVPFGRSVPSFGNVRVRMKGSKDTFGLGASSVCDADPVLTFVAGVSTCMFACGALRLAGIDPLRVALACSVTTGVSVTVAPVTAFAIVGAFLRGPSS